MAGPAVASSSAALSRTERVTACSTAQPLMTSPYSGAKVLRARVGLSPNSSQAAAGKRIEPPRSLACAMGTMPAAPAAAAPPLEPLVERVGSHGLRVAPCRAGSQVG